MRRVLSIDPGITTGIAVYDENGELDAALTVRKEKIYKNGFLTDLISLSHPEVILVENLPLNNVDKETQRLHAYFIARFRIAGFEVVEIQPSQWKGWAKRVEIPGQHARDAATMAKWWLEKDK